MEYTERRAEGELACWVGRNSCGFLPLRLNNNYFEAFPSVFCRAELDLQPLQAFFFLSRRTAGAQIQQKNSKVGTYSVPES